MKTILSIEDDHSMQENIIAILRLAGYNAIAAENGKQGLELALTNKPDLIVCDVMLPDLDGFGVLYTLNRSQECSDVPFIFLTARMEISDFRKGMSLGADDYLSKPFDDAELLRVIECRIRKKELARLPPPLPQALHSEDKPGLFQLKELPQKVRFYKKRELLISEGETPFGVFYINRGKVKTFKMNAEGKEYITGMYGQGDLLGHLSVIQNTCDNCSVSAIEDTEVFFIQKSEFLELLYSDIRFCNALLKAMAKDIHEKESCMIGLAYSSVRKRVADTLLRFGNAENEEGASHVFNVPVSREDLACIAGVAKETLIRTISAFKAESLVEIRRAKIRVTNPAELGRMKN